MAKNLEEVVEQLKGAVVAHGKQAETIQKHIKEMNRSDAPAMKLGRNKNKKACKKLWKDEEAKYLKKENGAQEWATEKRSLYCDGSKIITRTQKNSDADEYDTDEQMKNQNV